MQFLFQPLTWGVLLVGVPILIHLINMLRHRRVRWAAMDFLLESYRRNRRWVMLKQWLLLLARMLVMALLVAMLARWVSSAQWLDWFGGQTTHHYVLLDDSFSMREREQQGTPYTTALQAVGGLVRTIAMRPGDHQLTLIRWSRAALAMRGGEANARVDAAADLLGQSVPQNPDRLLDRINATAPVSLRLFPDAALELIRPLVEQNPQQRSEVYLVTDLRRDQFGQLEAVRESLEVLASAGSRLHLVDCGHDLAGRNLSVVSVEPEQEVWAAGVPLMVRVQVRNRGLQMAENVTLRVRSVVYGEGLAMTPNMAVPYSGDVVDLPPVVIEQIQPGETVARQVQVVFPVPGHHVVEVALPEDVLDDDNRRWCTIEVKQSQRILAIDGTIDRHNAFFLETAIRPGSQLNTGMQLEVHDASFLRDIAPELLAAYDVVTLLDVPRLDPAAVDKLIAYVRGGGGLLVMAGPNTNVEQINQSWYRGGDGFFPLPVQGIDELVNTLTGPQPPVVAAEHTILEPLTRLDVSPFLLLQIRKLLRVDMSLAEERGIQVVATGPHRRPLVIDSPVGEGRVVTLLTGIDPQWSNWAQDPTFVVLMLRSLGYLSSFRRPPTSYAVGDRIEWVVAEQQVLPDAELIVPAGPPGNRIRIQRPVELLEGGGARVAIEVDLSEESRDLLDPLLRPGVFEWWLLTAQGQPLVRSFAHNVAAAEGELRRVDATELERGLQGIDYQLHAAEDLAMTAVQADQGTYDMLLLIVLVGLLLGEQALAYSASYHPSPTSGARGGSR
ncbi:MAG: membrane protein [Pirellulaceae bacterium]|nr:MAG: membrane protein [Pirellulaceae bacterium]